MNTLRKNKVNYIDCLITISLLWFNGGLLGGLSQFNALVNIAVFVVVLFSVVLFNSKSIITLHRTGFFYGLLFLILIVFSMVLITKTISLDFWYILYAMMMLVYFQYLRYRPTEIQKGISRIILADRIIVNVYTYYLLGINSQLSRIFAQGGEMVLKEGYDTFLLAGYGFVYSTVILLTYLFFDRESWGNRSILDKLFIAVYAVTGFLLIVKAAYTIAIVIVSLFIILSFTFKRKKPIQNTFRVALLILGIFCVAPLVLELLAETIFKDTIVAVRFKEVVGMMSGNFSEADDIGVRIDLAMKTIKQFFKTPFFGVFEQGSNVNVLLGRHTEWLDGLAKFGIFRYILWLVFFAKAICVTIKRRKEKSVYLGVIICVIVLGFLNPIISEDVLLALFVLIPFIFPEENRKELKKDHG